MCYKGKPLRLAAAESSGCQDELVFIKKEIGLCGHHDHGGRSSVPSLSFQLRLAPPHANTSDSICASTSTLTSTSSSYTSVISPTRKCSHEKKVHFKERVKIRQIPGLRRYSRAQLAQMYHNKVELFTIRKEVVRQLRIIQFEEDIPDGEDDDTDICSRGLEPETKEGRRARQIHRRAALSIVLNEQTRQRKYGIVNPESIARLYSLTTKDSVYAAIEMGKWDAFGAQDYV